MIRNRDKLKLAMWLLLIVRNGAFAELKCYKGIRVDGNDGYNEKAVLRASGVLPVKFACDWKLTKLSTRTEIKVS